MYRGLLPSAIAMLPEAAITYGGLSPRSTSVVHMCMPMLVGLVATPSQPGNS
jgi:hypothetical protein